MKKILAIVCLCGLSFAAFAQEEKPASDKKASPELAALQTAASLAKYGYDNYSATALIEAAKIIAETPVQELDAQGTPSETQNVEQKQTRLRINPEELLADAQKYAGRDKVVVSYAKEVEKLVKAGSGTRGAVGGPRYGESRVYGKTHTDYEIKFWANELAEVIVIGDGDNDLDLYIYDQNGNLVASDTDYTDQCVCRWVPAWTGSFRIRIVNRGAIYSDFAIATN